MFALSRLLAASLAALLLAGCPSRHVPARVVGTEPTVTLTLLHLNDVYQFTPVDHGARGGLARVSTLRKQVLAQAPHTLFLLGGDTLSPSVESSVHKGKQMVDAWNTLGLDFAVLGNHEFDFGPDVLRQRMKESRFTWLGSNVLDKKTGQPFGGMPPFVIRELGGVKVGLLGLVLFISPEKSKVGQDVSFADTCATAKQLVPQMRAQGAQVIIALTHLDLREDKALARCAPIDVILGGHEHLLMQSVSHGTPILKMSAEARDLGRVTLHVGARSGRLHSLDWEVLPVTDEVAEDASFTAAMGEYHALLTKLSQYVGRTAVPLDARAERNRTHETNLGSFISDAYRRATGAEVALMNGGSIRSDSILDPGPLTERDVLALHPYPGSVVSLEVSGEVLRQALEHGVSRSAEESEPGRFPQVSGIRYAYDVCRPAGSRILSVTVNGEPLDPRRTYVLATNSYVADGGDGYTMFKGAPRRIGPDKGPTTQAVVREAFSSEDGISPETDGRIERLRAGSREQAQCPEEVIR